MGRNARYLENAAIAGCSLPSAFWLPAQTTSDSIASEAASDCSACSASGAKDLNGTCVFARLLQDAAQVKTGQSDGAWQVAGRDDLFEMRDCRTAQFLRPLAILSRLPGPLFCFKRATACTSRTRPLRISSCMASGLLGYSFWKRSDELCRFVDGAGQECRLAGKMQRVIREVQSAVGDFKTGPFRHELEKELFGSVVMCRSELTVSPIKK